MPSLAKAAVYADRLAAKAIYANRLVAKRKKLGVALHLMYWRTWLRS